MRLHGYRVHRLAAIGLAVAAAGGIVGLAWVRSAPGPHHEIDLAAQPLDVVARYEFVHKHVELVKQVPCYCGCGGALGHGSLLDCFVTRRGGYAAHAADCQVCRDEAEDAERLLVAGESPQAIRAFIDARYGEMGPPTRTSLGGTRP